MIYTKTILLSLLWLSSATADVVAQMWKCKNQNPNLDNLQYSQDDALALIAQAPLTKTENESGYPYFFNNGYDNLGRVKDPKNNPPLKFPVAHCNNPTKRSKGGGGINDHYLLEIPISPQDHPYPFGNRADPQFGLARVIYTYPDKTFCGIVAHPRGSQGALELCQQCKNVQLLNEDPSFFHASIMTTFIKWVTRASKRPPSNPLCFSTSGFRTVPPSEVLDEERFAHFKQGQYYPANIGDVLDSKYQIVGKLGFGTTSTVWLARDLENHQYVTLKIYTRGNGNEGEFQIYKQLNQGNSWHPGHAHIRRALDIFTIPRSGGDHPCLVQKPMWESFRDLIYRNPSHRFTEDLLKAGLMQVFLALDYLHTECKLVHTDIKSYNILQEIEDKSILESFTQAELANLSPRKFVNGMPVYASRRFDLPKVFGRAVLSDFGSAVRGDERRNHDAQPNIYRSPEVMLKTDWSYPIDIWNVGVMVWDLFEGRHLFYGNDPDGKGYSTRAHLAEVMGALGPPPLDMLQRGKRSHEFFTEDGKYSFRTQCA
ncbi:hypothetical protein HFD88_005777 [Aspergillus terreus]|nr:hypothetical protein HFD88_005777 [Aspergillus terreus]